MKRYLSLAIVSLFFVALLFGCVSDAAPEEERATEEPTTTTTMQTTAETAQPVQPIDPDNLLLGAWVTLEGGFCCRELRPFAMLTFFSDYTGTLECGYNTRTLTWQIATVAEAETYELTIVSMLPGSEPVGSSYIMELDENELRLDGVLFTRYR